MSLDYLGFLAIIPVVGIAYGLYKTYKEVQYNENNSIFNLFKPSSTGGVIDVRDANHLINLINTYPSVRVIGGGWNWNGQCFSKNDGVTVRLPQNIDDVKISSKGGEDGENMVVEVPAGVQVIDLVKLLKSMSYQLKSMGYCIHLDKSQTMGGLVATNVHHTGQDFVPFSESCTSVTVIHHNTEGENEGEYKEHTYTKEDEDFKLFFGTIGTLGIVTKLSFEIEPIKTYLFSKSIVSFDEVVIDGKTIEENTFEGDPKWVDNGEKKITVKQNERSGMKHNTMFTHAMYNPENRWNKYTAHEIKDPTENKEEDNAEGLDGKLSTFEESFIQRLAQKYLPLFLVRLLIKIIEGDSIEEYKVRGSYLTGGIGDYYHIESEFYIHESDFESVKNSKFIKGLYKECYVVYRYVPSIKNSIFTFSSDVPMIAVGFHNFKTGKDISEALYSKVTNYFCDNNISYYPHFGKYIGKYVNFSRFSQIFDIDEYEQKRHAFDPDKKFVCKYN